MIAYFSCNWDELMAIVSCNWDEEVVIVSYSWVETVVLILWIWHEAYKHSLASYVYLSVRLQTITIRTEEATFFVSKDHDPEHRGTHTASFFYNNWVSACQVAWYTTIARENSCQ
ncbi:hypothetical protein BVRB_1g011920 [Beta vulgaris subsp. vulgaris]|nr:hypothetical protein BVRB_1g011920 [Beta vulgaris subsp. vulgaris]